MTTYTQEKYKLTIPDARNFLHYEITRGDYVSNYKNYYIDDDIRRWYLQDLTSSTIDKRGGGFATRREALDALQENFEIKTYEDLINAHHARIK
jgi:hypothetical protein